MGKTLAWGRLKHRELCLCSSVDLCWNHCRLSHSMSFFSISYLINIHWKMCKGWARKNNKPINFECSLFHQDNHLSTPRAGLDNGQPQRLTYLRCFSIYNIAPWWSLTTFSSHFSYKHCDRTVIDFQSVLHPDPVPWHPHVSSGGISLRWITTCRCEGGSKR